MAGEGEEEEKGCMATTWDAIKSFFMAIFLAIEFVFKMIYYLFYYIVIGL